MKTLAGPVGALFGGTLLSQGASAVMGAPKPPTPAAMPDPGNPALIAARRQAAAALAGRSGRASTILSSPASGDYSSPILGTG